MKRNRRSVGADIRKHRFVSAISTTSKIFLDGKRKSRTRNALKRKLKEEASDL
jgi:hypothetical protein